MESLQINAAFEKGEEYLAMAHNALNYSNNSETTYLVCINAKNALVQYMISFLDHFGEDTYSSDPEVLLNQCKEISGNFQDLKIDDLLAWQDNNQKPSLVLAREAVHMAELARELMVCEML